jgi:hypothetical protein
MFHYDYVWDLYPNYLKLDRELPVAHLGWKQGDLFRFEEVNGERLLKKVDPIEKFVRGYDND